MAPSLVSWRQYKRYEKGYRGPEAASFGLFLREIPHDTEAWSKLVHSKNKQCKNNYCIFNTEGDYDEKQYDKVASEGYTYIHTTILCDEHIKRNT